jgi:hypothetical protein
MQSLKGLLFIVLLAAGELMAQKQTWSLNKNELVFSAIKGTTSKPDSIVLSSNQAVKIKNVKITGDDARQFRINSSLAAQANPAVIVVLFEPAKEFIGVALATLIVGTPELRIPLRGLSTNGLEGENEAPLTSVVAALGYKIDVGWNTLANHSRPELQGEELAPALFRKAGANRVEVIPVARYSPDFPLNYGLYTNEPSGPSQRLMGTLSKAGKFPEHQTLFPATVTQESFPDPGDAHFGIFATSPDHTIYSEDCWNMLFYPSRAAHAVRVYAVKDAGGKLHENTFLVCMEEAANGDFNDYVFILKNVVPVFLGEKFKPLMNGKDLSGWYPWLQSKGRNNDPEKVFAVEADGVLHVTGKELGYIMTNESFDNFHFKLEFRWGEKRWAPREANKRDSGICYNIPEFAGDTIWPSSVECQIQEGDVGDFWLLGNSTIQVDGKQNPPMNHSQIVKKKDGEKPTGEWNTVEVISFNGKCVHIVNGTVVNYGENSSLVGGRLLLQSEYAEVYYRNVVLREL